MFSSPESEDGVNGAGHGERRSDGGSEEMFLLQDGVRHSRSESRHGPRHILHEWPHYHPDHTGRLIDKLQPRVRHQVTCTAWRARYWFCVLHLGAAAFLTTSCCCCEISPAACSLNFLFRVSVATWRRVLGTLRSEAWWLVTTPGLTLPAAAAASDSPAWPRLCSSAEAYPSTSSLTSPPRPLW